MHTQLESCSVMLAMLAFCIYNNTLNNTSRSKCAYINGHFFINKSQIILKFSTDIDDYHDMILHKF